MRPVVTFALLLALCGCAKSPAELEVADDASCRKIITERNDARPTAYEECRSNLSAYRLQRSIAVSGR